MDFPNEPIWKQFVDWYGTDNGVRAYHLAFIDMTAHPNRKGRVNVKAGLMLSQILYWYNPNATGKTRLRIRKHGFNWLAKSQRDWYTECRLSCEEAESALVWLKELHLIETALFRFNGSPTTHIRIRWEVFLPRWCEVLATQTQPTNDTDGLGDFTPLERVIVEYAFEQIDEKETVKTSDLVTETTEEITSEKTAHIKIPPTAASLCARSSCGTVSSLSNTAKQTIQAAPFQEKRQEKRQRMQDAVDIFYPLYCQVQELDETEPCILGQYQRNQLAEIVEVACKGDLDLFEGACSQFFSAHNDFGKSRDWAVDALVCQFPTMVVWHIRDVQRAQAEAIDRSLKAERERRSQVARDAIREVEEEARRSPRK